MEICETAAGGVRGFPFRRGVQVAGAEGHLRQSGRNLAQACQEVEELFLSQLLASLRRTLLFGLKTPGPELEKLQSLADQEVARTLAAGGGLGLARRLYEQLAGARLPRPKGESDERSGADTGDQPRGDDP